MANWGWHVEVFETQPATHLWLLIAFLHEPTRSYKLDCKLIWYFCGKVPNENLLFWRRQSFEIFFCLTRVACQSSVPSGEQPDDRNSQMYLLESNQMTGTVYCTCWRAVGWPEQSTVPAGEQPDDRNSPPRCQNHPHRCLPSVPEPQRL